jgi:hypothetical protein
MMAKKDIVSSAPEQDHAAAIQWKPKGPNRRHFVGQLGSAMASLAAGALSASSVASAESAGSSAAVEGLTNKRVIQAFNLRVGEATHDALVPVAKNVNNGDDSRYPDKGGTYTKGLPHDSFGRVDHSESDNDLGERLCSVQQWKLNHDDYYFSKCYG